MLVGALVVAAYLAGAGALEVGQRHRQHGRLVARRRDRRGRGPAHAAAALADRSSRLLLLAFALANLTAGRSVLVSSLLGLADLAETIVVAILVTKYVGRRIVDVADVWRLFGIATVGALVAATGISLVYDRFLDTSFWPTLGLTLPSHAASVMLLAPVALLAVRRPQPNAVRTVELTAQACMLLAATLVTFGAAQLTLGFAPLPVIVWAAVRFSKWVVVIEQILYATAVTLLTQYGWGPFSPLVESDPGLSTQHAQLYLICLVLIGLPLVTAMAQRDKALVRLSASERVFRRTFTESRVPVALVMLDGGQVTFSDCNEATAERTAHADRRPRGPTARGPPGRAGAAWRPATTSSHDGATGWSGQIGVRGDPRIRLEVVLSLLEQGDDRVVLLPLHGRRHRARGAAGTPSGRAGLHPGRDRQREQHDRADPSRRDRDRREPGNDAAHRFHRGRAGGTADVGAADRGGPARRRRGPLRAAEPAPHG